MAGEAARQKGRPVEPAGAVCRRGLAGEPACGHGHGAAGLSRGRQHAPRREASQGRGAGVEGTRQAAAGGRAIRRRAGDSLYARDVLACPGDDRRLRTLRDDERREVRGDRSTGDRVCGQGAESRWRLEVHAGEGWRHVGDGLVCDGAEECRDGRPLGAGGDVRGCESFSRQRRDSGGRSLRLHAVCRWPGAVVRDTGRVGGRAPRAAVPWLASRRPATGDRARSTPRGEHPSGRLLGRWERAVCGEGRLRLVLHHAGVAPRRRRRLATLERPDEGGASEATDSERARGGLLGPSARQVGSHRRPAVHDLLLHQHA